MSSTMRAKMYVGYVQKIKQGSGSDEKTTQEVLTMHAVSAPRYPEDGSDEDNTYAKFCPARSWISTSPTRRCLGNSRSAISFTSTSPRSSNSGAVIGRSGGG